MPPQHPTIGIDSPLLGDSLPWGKERLLESLGLQHDNFRLCDASQGLVKLPEGQEPKNEIWGQHTITARRSGTGS